MKIRKANPNARWYTITVVSWEDRFYGKADYEVHFDVCKHGNGKYDAWEVSYRNGMHREDDISHKIASFDKLANAKRYLIALAEAHKAGAEMPKAADFEDYAFNAYAFENDDAWKRVAA